MISSVSATPMPFLKKPVESASRCPIGFLPLTHADTVRRKVWRSYAASHGDCGELATEMEGRNVTIHEGGCLCGAVRYRVEGEPVLSSVCSCTACQRRTGSAFGFGAYFKAEQVEILRGEPATYEHRSDETGRWLRFQFCTKCGTQVTWTAEALAGMRAV